MTILICAYAHVPGANTATVAIEELARSVQSQVDAVTLKVRGESHIERLQNGRLFRVPVTGDLVERRSAFCRAVRRQFDSQHYSAVQVRGPLEGLALLPRRKTHDFKLIYEVAETPPATKNQTTRAAWQAAHLRVAREADAMIVASTACHDAILKDVPGARVHKVAPGVNVDRYDSAPLGPEPPHRLLYLGRFTEDRDVATLLTAVAGLADAYPLELMLAGDPSGAQHSALRERVAKLELQQVVRLRGVPVPRAIPYLVESCHIGVVPADKGEQHMEWGRIPQPLLEYMACHRPVIAAGVPAVRELVTHGESGLHYEPGNPESLRACLIELLEDAELGRRLARQAHSQVRSRFSASHRRHAISHIFGELVPASASSRIWNGVFTTPADAELPEHPTPLQQSSFFSPNMASGTDLVSNDQDAEEGSQGEWRFEFQESLLDTAEMGTELRGEPDTRISRSPPPPSDEPGDTSGDSSL